jgi:hypothetical protein
MLRICVGCVLLFAAGCAGGAALPKTYPAVGTVVYKGGQPMTGGTVQFNSDTDPLLRVVGTIEKDGQFKLATTRDDAKADGAPEGVYRVFVIPPAVSDARDKVPEGHKGALPIVLPDPYRIGPRENTIKIELPTGPPKAVG